VGGQRSAGVGSLETKALEARRVVRPQNSGSVVKRVSIARRVRASGATPQSLPQIPVSTAAPATQPFPTNLNSGFSASKLQPCGFRASITARTIWAKAKVSSPESLVGVRALSLESRVLRRHR